MRNVVDPYLFILKNDGEFFSVAEPEPVEPKLFGDL